VKERRRALPVAARKPGGARHGSDKGGTGDESGAGEWRCRGKRLPDRERDRVERPGDQECGEGEGKLEREAEEEARLESGRPRDVTRVDEPLQVLLDGERQGRQEHERRACCPAARPSAESGQSSEGERNEQEPEADRERERRVAEVAVAAVGERISTRVSVRNGEPVGKSMAGE